MDVLHGFKGQLKNGKVHKLSKSLYGLKQFSRAWFERFSWSLVGFGY